MFQITYVRTGRENLKCKIRKEWKNRQQLNATEVIQFCFVLQHYPDGTRSSVGGRSM